jgi:hypothetical protein
MARVTKTSKSLQVFRGSKPKADVFERTAGGSSCCDTTAASTYDKLGCRVRFDNSLAHENPTGANEKFHFQKQRFPVEPLATQIAHLNKEGVGGQLSMLAIPTYAFVKGVGVVVLASEPGLTFKLVTRNGLVLPSTVKISVDVAGDACCPTRTQGAVSVVAPFGQLAAGITEQYLFGQDATGKFSLEADEIMLEVVTMPTSGVIAGTFDVMVSVSYDIINRAES